MRMTRFWGWMIAGAVAATALPGCAVSEADVHRWETTEQGPNKLYAVVTHDKYAWPLRVEASLSLIRMKPRRGKSWGIPYLVDGFVDENGETRDGALLAVPPETRRKLIESLTPELVKEVEQPPPPKNPDGTRPPDPSVPFKDAAFAILSHDPPLVTDDAVKHDLAQAIAQWASTDFETRLDYTAQQYGIEQMLRYLGPSSIKPLPAMINEQSTKVDRISGLIADLGDADTKLKASQALVALAKTIDSPAWIAKQTPLVREADKGQKVTEDQIKQQVVKFQEQELIKVFASMKRVGGRPAIEYCFAYAGQKNAPEERRKAAVAALEGKVDKNVPADINTLTDIARDDSTPDSVRDLAFQRLGELPKEVAVPKMYSLFDVSKKWKVRWVAAELVLKTITTRELPDFMSRLPKSPAQKMGMTEAIQYGGLIQKMDAPAGAPKPRDAILPFLRAGEMGPKLVALGYFYDGSKKDVGVVQPHGDDKQPVPKCDKDDECGWQCDVPVAGGKPGQTESKDVTTVGEFVRFCVIPSMRNP